MEVGPWVCISKGKEELDGIKLRNDGRGENSFHLEQEGSEIVWIFNIKINSNSFGIIRIVFEN